MDADYDPTQQRVKMKKKKKGKDKVMLEKSSMHDEQKMTMDRKRRWSKFAEALEKPKPLFDPSI